MQGTVEECISNTVKTMNIGRKSLQLNDEQ